MSDKIPSVTTPSSSDKTALNDLPPLSLYVHIPWCVRKCPYCDFNSHTADTLAENHYVDALIADLDQELVHVQGRLLHSIFFGGGTPSLFSAAAIDTILTAIQQRIAFEPLIEITLEANPGTVEQHKFADFHSAGVNRLSIGIQSFNNKHLETLGRIHNSDEAINAIQTAQQVGFNNINIDLMHGLPHQTPAEGLADLKTAIELKPTHISWYQLTIEPNTAFYHSQPTLPTDDQLANIQAAGEQLLAHHGFQHYEVSAYCQPNKQSQHNINYWLFGDYIGIGAGAHGKTTSVAQQTITRRWKTRMPANYLDTHKNFCAGEKTLNTSELPIEFMMNALRLSNGFSLSDFYRHTGLPFSMIKKNIQQLIEKGLLEQQEDRIMTSTTGKRFLNEVLMVF